MKLPNIENAIVVPSKITDYLLSETHPDGQTKAAFFAQFGFSVESWEVLARSLIQHAEANEVTAAVATPHGTKYVVEGVFSAPDGRAPTIRSVWLVEGSESSPRLITAYPLKGS
ncbi:MAG TPA: hypothetical protein VMT34_15825 [Aggregatilineales bacterium]|nr:hypothetical protein [Aggregatilineales bacterium]